MSEDRAQAKAKLADIVKRVMADGKIDASEREEMQSVYRAALLTVIDVKEVLTGYLGVVRDEVLADGKVTDEERARCRAVLAALKLPRELVPAGLSSAARFLKRTNRASSDCLLGRASEPETRQLPGWARFRVSQSRQRRTFGFRFGFGMSP